MYHSWPFSDRRLAKFLVGISVRGTSNVAWVVTFPSVERQYYFAEAGINSPPTNNGAPLFSGSAHWTIVIVMGSIFLREVRDSIW